jgi:hypothetical protein
LPIANRAIHGLIAHSGNGALNCVIASMLHCPIQEWPIAPLTQLPGECPDWQLAIVNGR